MVLGSPAGIAVLSLLVRFFEFSLLIAVLLFFGSASLCLRYVIVLTYRGPPGCVPKVFPVREEVRSTTRCCEGLSWFVNSLNQLPARSKVSRGKGE